MPSQGHWSLLLVMDKEQGLSLPSIAVLINIVDLPMTRLGMETGFVLWACALSCRRGRLFWAHNGPCVGLCGQLLLFPSSPGLQHCRGHSGPAPACGQMHTQTHRHGTGCSGDCPLLPWTGEDSCCFAKMCHSNFCLKLYYFFGSPVGSCGRRRLCSLRNVR